MSAPEPGLEIQAAARLLAEGRATEAARGLEPLVEAAPAYAAALVLLARAYESNGREPESLAMWHRAHFLVPTSPLVRRERQRLLDAGVEAPAPRPVASAQPAPPSTATPEDEVAAMPAPPAEPVSESPMDAVWSDDDGEEGAPGEAQRETGEWTDVHDAPPPLDVASDDNEMAPIDWMVDADARRGAGVMPSDPGESESAGLFSEDAFAPEEPFTAAPAVAPADDDDDENEGWAVLDETDERERETEAIPSEVDVAPPPGHPPPSYWRVVPTGSRPPLAEEDLDSLIRQIEDAPRIRPDPHFVPPATFEVEPAARDDEDVVSETLARIYASQGQYAEAAAVYEKLALQRPADAETFRERAAEMRGRGESADG
jgi:tetratricopeptide (TPR) repeat protein